MKGNGTQLVLLIIGTAVGTLIALAVAGWVAKKKLDEQTEGNALLRFLSK